MLKDKNDFLKLFLIIGIFIIIILLTFGVRTKNNRLKRKVMPNKENIVALFNNINDNYTLEIEENINEDINNIVYSRDKNIILFEGKLSADGYLAYNEKLFELDSKKEKITRSKLSVDKIENSFYDIELLKSIVNYCEIGYVTNVKALCKINYSDYLNEYNKRYNANIENNIDNKMDIYIVHYADRIGKVIVDYTGINKIINKNDDSVKYGIKINDIDKNDYSEYLNYFSKELNKKK